MLHEVDKFNKIWAKGLEVPHEIKFVYLKWYCPNNVLKNQCYVSMKRHPMSK